MEKGKPKPEITMSNIRGVWGAFLLAQGILYIAPMLNRRTDVPVDPSIFNFSDTAHYVLAVAALGCIVASFYLPRFATEKARISLSANASRADILRVFYVHLLIRLWSLNACSLLGLALATMWGNPSKMLPFIGLSTIGFLMNAPSENKVESWSRT